MEAMELLVTSDAFSPSAWLALLALITALAVWARRRSGDPSAESAGFVALSWMFGGSVVAWKAFPHLPVWPGLGALVILRDLGFHFGLVAAAVCWIALVAGGVLEHLRLRHGLRRWVSPWQAVCGAWVVLVTMAWTMRIPMQDVQDFCSVPAQTAGVAAGSFRPEAGVDGCLWVYRVGSLKMAHGISLRGHPGRCAVVFTPHRRLVLSVSQPGSDDI